MNLRNQKKANMDEEGKKEAQNKKSDKHRQHLSFSAYSDYFIFFPLIDMNN